MIQFEKEFFDQLHTLKMNLPMYLSIGMNGARKSSAKGSSVEFSDYREYIPGDDIRRIDWNAYGRTDKLYIKQFMEEKEGLFHIFVDTSASMQFGEPSKAERALQITAALSYLILGNLDRLYINEMRENTVVRGKGVTGMAAFPHVLETLSNMQFAGSTMLNKAVMSRSLQPSGVTFLISDFLDGEGVEEAVRYLAYRKQTICFVQILAKEELDITYEGTCNLQDMESGDKVKITMSKATIRQYMDSLAALQEELGKLARRYGAYYISVRSDTPLVETMLEGFRGILSGKR